MKVSLYIVFFLFFQLAYTQQEFHVFPKNHQETPGKPTGDGSLNNPWDLQTALSQSTSVVNGGDIIWLHEGIYNGRYKSLLKSTIKNQYITVSAFQDDRVILNGNVKTTAKPVLHVTGSQVIYKNFEVTFLGNFSRNENDPQMQKVGGISHTNGVDCKFNNLKIYNIPGLGIGSWNGTGGSIIEQCYIFNNGFIYKKGKGGGEGIYVQNSSDTETRIIRNNIIFGNYYKGIEVWSANRDANRSYVKNIILEDNVIFNSGLPINKTVDNIIIGTNDRNGINIAHNIKVKNNILYHNADFQKGEINGNAASLTLGFYKKAPVENIIVDKNIIIGRNNALRLLHIKSLSFTNNIVYSGYVQLNNNIINNLKGENWGFNNNIFYTKNNTAYYNLQTKRKYLPKDWNEILTIKEKNIFKKRNEFNLEPVLDISKNKFVEHSYRVVLFSKKEEDIVVNFNNQEITEGAQYIIRDVENLSEVLKNGVISKDKNIEFPMKLNKGSKTKTLDNFGVFIVEFSEPKKVKVGFFKRIFGWLF